MWICGQWFEECELTAYIKKLEQERDAYKKELDTLKAEWEEDDSIND